MAVDTNVKGQFSFIIAPVDMKQILVIDEKTKKTKNATSAVKGNEVQSILSTELTEGVTIKANNTIQNRSAKLQDDDYTK